MDLGTNKIFLNREIDDLCFYPSLNLRPQEKMASLMK